LAAASSASRVRIIRAAPVNSLKKIVSVVSGKLP
jgi:hypothetical protein